MVRKREDGRWEGRIVIGHKENGEPIFRYIYADTQKELTAKLRQNITAYQGVDLTVECRMTLSEWLDRRPEQMESVLRSSTLEHYRRNLEHHIKPYLGQKKLTQITASDLRKLYDDLKKQGRVHPRPGQSRGLTTTTVHSIHITLHHALKSAVDQWLLPYNPADHVEPPKVAHKPMTILNEEQLDTFLAAVEQDSIWKDFSYSELTTGLRLGEICGLMWFDFDPRKETLNVNRTLHKEKGGRLVTGDTKTYAGTRKIVLPPITAELLSNRKKHSYSVWIFPNPLKPEMPMNPSAAYRQMKAVLTENSLPGLRFHDLRHTFATASLEHGMDVKTLSTIIGHVSSSTTLNIYAHVTGEMQRTAAAKIDRGIVKSETAQEVDTAPRNPPPSTFQPYKGQRRKPGSGCVSQINDHLWEGRYSPIVNGKRMARKVYASTEEECEEKLAQLIREMKQEIADMKAQLKTG